MVSEAKASSDGTLNHGITSIHWRSVRKSLQKQSQYTFEIYIRKAFERHVLSWQWNENKRLNREHSDTERVPKVGPTNGKAKNSSRFRYDQTKKIRWPHWIMISLENKNWFKNWFNYYGWLEFTVLSTVSPNLRPSLCWTGRKCTDSRTGHRKFMFGCIGYD